MKYLILGVFLISIIALAGCSQTVVKYQCADGSFVDSANLCPRSDTQTNCPELDCSAYGVEVQSENTNTEIKSVSEPNLLITINSASDTTRYLHNPTITIANEGGAVNNLVYDVELYKSSKLIASDTDILYKSGSTSIRSIDTGDSVKGYLNIMIYSGNTDGFTTGTHTLKIIVRKGASAKPIATAEKEVTFS